MNTPLEPQKSNTVQKLPLQTEKYSKRLEVPYDNVQFNELSSRSFDFLIPPNQILPTKYMCTKETNIQSTNNSTKIKNSSSIKLKWPTSVFVKFIVKCQA